MENKYKNFKPFDKVLIRKDECYMWMYDFYSHYDKDAEKHVCIVEPTFVSDDNIIPFEGNDYLVGTFDEPEEDIKLEEGEIVFYFDDINDFERLDVYIGRIDKVGQNQIEIKYNTKWTYIIRFKDFNPDDMEETRKHIIYVKNGKLVRCKKLEIFPNEV